MVRAGAFALAALLYAMGASAEGKPPQTEVFYNARIALREARTHDALKLWLLRNTLRQRGLPGTHDGDFRSVVWAALGDLGMCQDGLPKDDDGAGLWPLAFHNYLARSLAKGPPSSQQPPWDVFEAGRQQRWVSLNDVLSAEELRTVTFFRTWCFLPQAMLVVRGEPRWFHPEDRLRVGLMMRDMLEQSLRSLSRFKVRSTAAIEARIFDLDLALAQLQAREARRDGADLAQRARSAGASKEAATELRKTRGSAWAKGSAQAAFLQRSLTWSADEWMTLSPRRRMSLFAQARPLAEDAEALTALELAIMDRLISERQGEEVEAWLGFLDAAESAELRRAATGGDRGRRLLELEPETGFRARAEVALHRGVGFLEAGALEDALRSFAYALKHSEEGRQGEVTAGLARRWLSFVLARFATTDDVLATLKALVPRQELNRVLEDLLWRAALRADVASFERVVEHTHRGGALDSRVALLRPLANGKAGAMATDLRDAAEDEPHAVLRFVRQYLEALEVEDAEVRRAHIATLKLLLGVLDGYLDPNAKRSSQVRTAEELSGRARAILDGLEQLDVSEPGKARSLSLHHESYAGAIRLAPSDPLPWPFRMPEPEAPSAFAVLKLQPVEWRNAQGKLVFGWRISE